MAKPKIITKIFFFLPGILAFLNLLTVFVPEIGFDALWYHLTLPKLFLLKHQWFIPGGLLYYSVMPRLAETIFIPLVQVSGFVGPKFVQFAAGIGTCLIMNQLAKKLKLTNVQSLLAISLFYGTWLVSWQSGSAYVDLVRTFLETTALYLLISDRKVFGGIFLGLAVGTKWLSLGSVVIYSLVFGISIGFVALFYALPWFLISLYYTGNPIYPIFSSANISHLAGPFEILLRLLKMPLYLVKPFDDYFSFVTFSLPVLASQSFFSKNKTLYQVGLIGLLGLASTMILTPPSSRFFLPYLPMLSLSAVYVVAKLPEKLSRIFIYLALSSLAVVIVGRVVVISRFLPYLLGQQNTNQFLTVNSYRLPDTFIDSDNFVKENLKPTNEILIDKLHNLYYFPYDFDHVTWADPKINYDYLITRDTDPSDIKGRLLNTNQVGIQVYRLYHD